MKSSQEGSNWRFGRLRFSSQKGNSDGLTNVTEEKERTMKNSWTPVVVTLVLVTWLGFASTSNKKVALKDNRVFGALTARGPSAGAVKVHPELRRVNTDVVLVDQLDG